MEQVSEKLSMRLTPQMRARLEAKAARLGIAPAVYARMVLSGVAEPLGRCGDEAGEPLPKLLTR